MNTSHLATLAWRNIWRNRRRTLITLFAISFGVLLAATITGLGDYSYGRMIDHAAKIGGGHVVVQHPEFQELPNLKKTVGDAGAVRETAEADPRVVRAVPRITGAALVATAASSQGASFMAIDPAAEDTSTLAVLDDVVEGEMLAGTDTAGVVLGYKLAETLGLRLGKKLVYTVTDRHGEIVSGLARVKGLVKTGSPSLDGGLCLLPIDTMRKLLGYGPDEATQVAIFVGDHRDATDVAATMQASVQPDAVALDWAEASPELAGFIAMDRGGAIAIEITVMFLLAAGVFNTLLVSVLERMREFGIMTALGFSAGALFVLVMWESIWIAAVGLVAAAVLTAWPYHYLATTGIDYSEMVGEGSEVAGIAIESVLRADLHFESGVVIVLCVFVSTIAAGLYPAWKAGRTNPADVIRLQ
ncbi:MAG: ABC transporter permease [Myxococcota bacterium]